MTKSEIYQYINNKKKNFLPKYKGTIDNKFKQFIIEEKLNINDFHTNKVSDLYDYLKGINGEHNRKCINTKCSKDCKFYSFSIGYSKFCSKKCLYKWRSENMIGDKNNIHKASKETLKEIGRKNSIRIKKAIAEGTFTPNITNSWARSKCTVKIKRNNKIVNIKTRSSWEAYFQIKNPFFLYEKLRVPYMYKNKFHNYILDFIDEESKTIYEIKPDGFKNNKLVKIKESAAKKWALDNGYDFKFISNDWFKNNYDESLLKGQPEEEKLKRLLKQFYEN